MATAYRIALVLVDVVHAQAAGEGLPEHVEAYALGNHGFEIGQGLDTGAAVPGRVPAQEISYNFV